MLPNNSALASNSPVGLQLDLYPALPDRPVSSNLTRIGDACGDKGSVDLVIEKFATDMDSVIVQMPGLSGSARELGLEATRQFRELDPAYRPNLCLELDGNEELWTSMNRALELRQGDQLNGVACPTTEAVLILGALKERIDYITIVLDAVCESTACPPPFTPPLCPIACGLPTASTILSATLDSAISIGDKCVLSDHESMMETARNDGKSLVRKLSEDIERSKFASTTILDDAARQDDLESLRDSVIAGFDGGGFRGEGPAGGDEGLNPLLASLGEAVQTQSQDQASFESSALRALMESRLASASGLARMRLPASSGGFIEMVRETVALRIQATAASGGDTEPALVSFREGNAALNESRYQDAYLAFEQAYLLLEPGSGGATGTKEATP